MNRLDQTKEAQVSQLQLTTWKLSCFHHLEDSIFFFCPLIGKIALIYNLIIETMSTFQLY